MSRQASGQWVNLPGRLDTTIVERLGDCMRNRLTGRQKDKADRKAQLWAAKYAAADTPAKLAAFEFDRIRSRIDELPANRQPAAYKKLARLLSDHHANLGEITASDVHA